MDIRLLSITLLLIGFFSACLDMENPDIERTLWNVYLLDEFSGNCLIRGTAIDRSDSQIYLCGRFAKTNCNQNSFRFSEPELSTLRAGIAELGLEHTSCSSDAVDEIAFIDSYSNDLPFKLAKYNIQPDTLEFRTVSDCRDLPVFENSIEQLTQPAILNRVSDSNLFLSLFANEQTCFDSIPLSTQERETIGAIRAGSKIFFSTCYTGTLLASDELECPANLADLFI